PAAGDIESGLDVHSTSPAGSLGPLSGWPRHPATSSSTNMRLATFTEMRAKFTQLKVPQLVGLRRMGQIRRSGVTKPRAGTFKGCPPLVEAMQRRLFLSLAAVALLVVSGCVAPAGVKPASTGPRAFEPLTEATHKLGKFLS